MAEYSVNVEGRIPSTRSEFVSREGSLWGSELANIEAFLRSSRFDVGCLSFWAF